ncbi:hypothetical protein BDW67DRAFT_172070 [Aspergillus spinulosporus]
MPTLNAMKSKLNKAAPYWFSNIVPLAWTLDKRLKAQAKTFLDYVLDHQTEDGCRIVTAMHKFTSLAYSMLQNNFTGLFQDKTQNDNSVPYLFGLLQTHELSLALQWLHQNCRGARKSITVDEHLGGISPQRGSELCMAVEMMYSMAYLYRMYGINNYADLDERPAFNALPATGGSTTSGWSPSSPAAPSTTLQGHPKYAASYYVLERRDHIVHGLHGPTTLDTKICGERVKIASDRNYPFSRRLQYAINSKTDFELSVQVPTWALDSSKSTYHIGKHERRPLSPNSESQQQFKIKRGMTDLEINLHMDPGMSSRRSGCVAIYYGPLLYALDIEFENPTSLSPLSWTDLTLLPSDEVLKDWQVQKKGRNLANHIWARDATPVALWILAWVID